MGFLRWLSGKESACHAGDPGSGSGRSLGEGNGNPLQYNAYKLKGVFQIWLTGKCCIGKCPHALPC